MDHKSQNRCHHEKTDQPLHHQTGWRNRRAQFSAAPSVDSSAIINLDTSVFVLDSSDAGILIKSVAKNGDALNTFSSPPSETETRFSPDDGSAKFRWKFIAAN